MLQNSISGVELHIAHTYETVNATI